MTLHSSFSPFSPPSTEIQSAPEPLTVFDPIEWDDGALDSDSPRKRDQPAYLPTPEQIFAACAEIRAGWSLDERARRGIGPRRKY